MQEVLSVQIGYSGVWLGVFYDTSTGIVCGWVWLLLGGPSRDTDVPLQYRDYQDNPIVYTNFASTEAARDTSGGKNCVRYRSGPWFTETCTFFEDTFCERPTQGLVDYSGGDWFVYEGVQYGLSRSTVCSWCHVLEKMASAGLSVVIFLRPVGWKHLQPVKQPLLHPGSRQFEAQPNQPWLQLA